MNAVHPGEDPVVERLRAERYASDAGLAPSQGGGGGHVLGIGLEGDFRARREVDPVAQDGQQLCDPCAAET